MSEKKNANPSSDAVVPNVEKSVVLISEIASDAESDKDTREKEDEKHQRFSAAKAKSRCILAVFDLFDFQHLRFSDPNLEVPQMENKAKFFAKIGDMLNKNVSKSDIDWSMVIAKWQEFADRSGTAEVGPTRECFVSAFKHLMNATEDIAIGCGLKFMPVNESDEDKLNFLALEENADEDRLEVIRRGLIYQDKEQKEFSVVIRYQEVKKYEKRKED